MTELQRQLYRTLYKKSFYDFLKDFWNEADPSKFVDGILLQFYCETFQYMCRNWIGYENIKIDVPEQSEEIDVIDVRQNKNKININIPPRHSKSMVFNVLAGVWCWLNFPLKVASISHTEGLAGKMNTMRKKIINSEKFKFFFPEIELDTNTATKLVDKRGGELYSLNRNAMTGYGADIIVNDDLTNAEAARKDKEEMNNAWSYYQNTMPSRINDPNKYIIINIQQRLAPNDITGHIMNDTKLREEYTFVVLPAIFEKTTYLICPISGDVFKFEKGASLWKERFGDYSSLRVQVGETVFQTQYLQNPISSDKVVIKEDMLLERNATDCPGYDISSNGIDISNVNMIYSSHDFPVKDKESSDYLGSILSYTVGSTLYLVDCLEKRMSYTDSVNYVTNMDYAYPGMIQIIEDKANGSPILQQLQDVIPGLQAYQPGTASKQQRLESASLYLRNVVFVKSKYDKLTNTYVLPDGLLNLKQRLLQFPFVKNDDIIDSFSQLVLFVFMDRRYRVYGKSLTDENIIKDIPYCDYSTIFFNKEGDVWKALDIGVQYSFHTTLYVKREILFKASIKDGINKLKEFAGDKNVFINCSSSNELNGIYQDNAIIETYQIDDFEKSVALLSNGFSNNIVFLSEQCRLTKTDIDNFKFDKSKDPNVMKFKTEKDGFVSCLRVAMKYYGLNY